MPRPTTLLDHAIVASIGTMLAFNIFVLAQQLYAAATPGLA